MGEQRESQASPEYSINEEDDSETARTLIERDGLEKTHGCSEENLQSLSIAERSKVVRARRNREAAHRSRAKNKIRQSLIEEETQRRLAVNKKLKKLLEQLLYDLGDPKPPQERELEGL